MLLWFWYIIFFIQWTPSLVERSTAANLPQTSKAKPDPDFDYLTAIRDQQDGFYLATSESNYALASEKLASVNLSAVSVNDHQVALLSVDDKITITTFDSLNDEVRKGIKATKSEFLSQLSGLNLVIEPEKASTTGSSARELGERPTVVQVVVESEDDEGEDDGNEKDDEDDEEKKDDEDDDNKIKKFIYRSYTPSKNSINIKEDEDRDEKEDTSSMELSLDDFSYHNVAKSSLNETLGGDVFQIDSRGNLISIYSSTASVYRQLQSITTIHVDADHFYRSQPDLPHSLNSFGLMGEFAYFVYQDGMVVTKPATMVNKVEFKLLSKVQAELSDIDERLGDDSPDELNDDQDESSEDQSNDSVDDDDEENDGQQQEEFLPISKGQQQQTEAQGSELNE